MCTIQEYFNDIDEMPLPEINYFAITHDDMLNGDGLRVVLWVAGCTHHCEGCQNPYTWDSKGGIPLTQWEEAEFWMWLEKEHTQGATFSGGDPLHPSNRKKIGDMAFVIKSNSKYVGKDIYVYTGYRMEQNQNGFYFSDGRGEEFVLPWLDKIDVLIDGRFDKLQRQQDIEENKTVYWRGSSNQRVIDVQETLRTNSITLWCE